MEWDGHREWEGGRSWIGCGGGERVAEVSGEEGWSWRGGWKGRIVERVGGGGTCREGRSRGGAGAVRGRAGHADGRAAAGGRRIER